MNKCCSYCTYCVESTSGRKDCTHPLIIEDCGGVPITINKPNEPFTEVDACIEFEPNLFYKVGELYELLEVYTHSQKMRGITRSEAMQIIDDKIREALRRVQHERYGNSK